MRRVSNGKRSPRYVDARGGIDARCCLELVRLTSQWLTRYSSDPQGGYETSFRDNSASRSCTALGTSEHAAAEEDAVEKLPVTPGPIIPAREQLADLLLVLNRPKEALTEFETSLTEAPGRRGALIGAARAAELLGEKTKAEQFRTILR